MRILFKALASAGMLALSAAAAFGVKKLLNAQKKHQANVDDKIGNVDEEGMDVVENTDDVRADNADGMDAE